MNCLIISIRYRVTPPKILPLNKASNVSLLFYCLDIFDSERLFLTGILTPQPLKYDKSSWRHTNLKTESRFQERQILAIFG